MSCNAEEKKKLVCTPCFITELFTAGIRAFDVVKVNL